jgi:hypothetical protein
MFRPHGRRTELAGTDIANVDVELFFVGDCFGSRKLAFVIPGWSEGPDPESMVPQQYRERWIPGPHLRCAPE